MRRLSRSKKKTISTLIAWCRSLKCTSSNTLSYNFDIRLGAYMAIPLKINNYLSETTFNDSLEDRIQFKRAEA